MRVRQPLEQASKNRESPTTMQCRSKSCPC